MWTRKLIELLLWQYEQYEFLYNVKHRDYHNRDKRSKCMFAICESLKKENSKLTVEDVKLKINGMRTQYIRETRKVKASEKNSASRNGVYVPRLWFYPIMGFLLPHLDWSRLCQNNKTNGNEELHMEQEIVPEDTSSGNSPQFMLQNNQKIANEEENVETKIVPVDISVDNESEDISLDNVLASMIQKSWNINENVCRVCLQHNIVLNWNEEISEFSGMSYKDCYYKYTKLEENDADCLPTNLCAICANEIKNAHQLFEKALESFSILQVALTCKTNKSEYCDMEILNNQSTTNFDGNESTDSSKQISRNNNQKMIEIEDEEVSFPSNENLEETKNAITNSEEMSIKENVTIEPVHFVDIKNFETEILNISDNSDIKSPGKSTSDRTGKIRKKFLVMCSYCSLMVNGTNQLIKHEATHRIDRQRTETCPQCGIKLYTKVALASHMQVHDEKREKKYKCEFCEKAFFNRGALNVHRRIHLGLMVKCQFCTKEFYRQIDLNRHMTQHSATPLQKNGQKQLKYTVQCEYCNKRVRTDKWKTHKAAHLNQPQVKCKICNKNFFARSNCVKHLRKIHDKSKNVYEEFIHYYNSKARMSHLMIKQQAVVKPIE